MIGPIFYVLLIFALVAAPAFGGWKLSRKHGQLIRMAGTVMTGQVVLTPVVAYITFSESTIVADNPVKTALTYAAMGVVISIMTFVVLEIRNTTKSRKSTASVTGTDTRNDPAIVEIAKRLKPDVNVAWLPFWASLPIPGLLVVYWLFNLWWLQSDHCLDGQVCCREGIVYMSVGAAVGMFGSFFVGMTTSILWINWRKKK